jgi:hypothetical protein
MVSAQNGDHRNGHVLVENQQTRLNPDNETHEATSKSKDYRINILLYVYNIIRKNNDAHMSLETHATSRVRANVGKKYF